MYIIDISLLETLKLLNFFFNRLVPRSILGASLKKKNQEGIVYHIVILFLCNFEKTKKTQYTENVNVYIRFVKHFIIH